jgi:hypothetical protein
MFMQNPEYFVLSYTIGQKTKKYPVGLMSSPPRWMESQEHTTLLLVIPNKRVTTMVIFSTYVKSFISQGSFIGFRLLRMVDG